jgi:hypothetical protein
MSALIASLLMVARLSSGDLLGRAEAEYANSSFARALEFSESALSEGGTTRAQRIAAYRIAAFSLIALGNQAGAKIKLRLWLLEEPDAKMTTGTSPKVRRLFEEVRAALAVESKSIAASIPTSAPASAPVKIASPNGASSSASTQPVFLQPPPSEVGPRAPAKLPAWSWVVIGIGSAAVIGAAAGAAYALTRPTELVVRVEP